MRYCDFRRMFDRLRPSYYGYDASDISFYARMLYENLQFSGIEVKDDRNVNDTGSDAIKDWLAGARVYYRDCDFYRGYDTFIFAYHDTALYGAVHTFLNALREFDFTEYDAKRIGMLPWRLPSGEYFFTSHLCHVYYIYPIGNPTQFSLLITSSDQSLLLGRDGSVLVSREGELFMATNEMKLDEGICSFIRVTETSTHNCIHHKDLKAVEFKSVTTTSELNLLTLNDVRAAIKGF